MNRLSRDVVGLLFLIAGCSLAAGCTSSGPGQMADDGADTGADSGEDAGAGDPNDLDRPDVSFPDGDRADASVPDQGLPDAGIPDSGDPGSSDAGPTAFCRSMDDCSLDEVCDFPSGLCERRDSTQQSPLALFSFHPSSGGTGDLLLIDGRHFFGTLVEAFKVSVQIGATPYTAISGSMQAGRNRILVWLGSGAGGAVEVTGGDGTKATAPQPLGAAPAGVLPCDASTPGEGTEGTAIGETGPYAAGYLELSGWSTRVFYPARCGGIRRPAVAGTWPLVVVLHANGASFMVYEFLGQFLATWGMVTALVDHEDILDYDASVIQGIAAAIGNLRGRSLDSLHPALAGAATSSRIALAGHSRGCARVQWLFADNTELAQACAATIFMGPADEGDVVPGLFLVVGATKDGQVGLANVDNAYARQARPRWEVVVNGGTHSLFTDDEIFDNDGVPTITRHQQLGVVLSFALPVLQRAFGLDQPFAAQLDTPPASALFVVTADP